jgi:hypothetical protein
MARSTQTASSNGAGAPNLFCETEEHPAPAPTKRSAGRGGRGLIVAIDEPAAAPGEAGAPRFTRASSGLDALPAIARQRAARADRNARRLLQRITARRYGALAAFAVAGALLLAMSGLGLSLGWVANARDHLRDQRATATRALTAARAQTRAVGAQRDQARRAATAAHTGRVLARGSRRRWKQRAERAQRQLTATRTAAQDAKHKG